VQSLALIEVMICIFHSLPRYYIERYEDAQPYRQPVASDPMAVQTLLTQIKSQHKASKCMMVCFIQVYLMMQFRQSITAVIYEELNYKLKQNAVK